MLYNIKNILKTSRDISLDLKLPTDIISMPRNRYFYSKTLSFNIKNFCGRPGKLDRSFLIDLKLPTDIISMPRNRHFYSKTPVSFNIKNNVDNPVFRVVLFFLNFFQKIQLEVLTLIFLCLILTIQKYLIY